MAKLYILSGSEEGRVIELFEDRVTVGRAPDNMILLPDESVSTYHATLIRDGTDYRLRDLNSSNYCRVNGTRIVESKLKDGDRVRFGIVEARFEADLKATVMIEPPPMPRAVPSAPPPVPASAAPPMWPGSPSGPSSPWTPPGAVPDGTTSSWVPQSSPPLVEPPLIPVARPSGGGRGDLLKWVAIGAGVTITLGVMVAVFVAGRMMERVKSATAVEKSQAAVRKSVAAARKVAPSNEVPVAVTPPDEMMGQTEPKKEPVPPKPATVVVVETNVAPVVVPKVTPPVEEKPTPPVPVKPTPEEVKPVKPAVVPKPVVEPRRNVAGNATPLAVKANPYDGQNVMVAANAVDQLVFGQLQRLGIAPASACSDATFVRRVYFDVIGTLPSVAEVQAFLDDRTPNKRSVLVDRLLERDEFADYWAMKWCDLLRVKAEFPINLWPNAVQTYHQWIRTSLKENRPYDRFARDLLTSSGSNFREAPVNFYRAVQSKDAPSLAQTVALTFMGERAEKWPKEKLAGMAMFFSQVGYKSTSEWKEEIVYYDSSKATNASAVAVFPDGTTAMLPVGKDPRAIFANWLITPSNPWFGRNIANRIWSWLMGRGIIHEPDDIRPDNPPVNPELLALLERELVANKYDMKAVYRLILKSRTYQLSSVPRSSDSQAEANFAFYPVRRMEAEVLIDAINQITGTTEKYSSPIPEPFTFIPENLRSIALADGSISSPFLDLFGRSSRATGMESERNNRPTASQQLHLLNSSHIQRKITDSNRLRTLLQQAKGKPRGVVDLLYLTILSRYPTDEEVKVISAYNKSGDWSQRTGLDLAWALMNSAEFQSRH